MGGSSSGSGGFSGPTAFTGGDVCNIRMRTSVAGPNKDVLDASTVGEVLDVQLIHEHVTLKKGGGDSLGKVIPPQLTVLKDCIRQGRAYEAEIMIIDGGYCEVLIRPKT